MKIRQRMYEPHLTVEKVSIAPQAEWLPCSTSWSMLQIASGTGYWLDPKMRSSATPGTLILTAPGAPGCIRASQLGKLGLYSFSVRPERLTGLFSLAEQQAFRSTVSIGGFFSSIFPPESIQASKMRELMCNTSKAGSAFRLQLLQLFFEVFGGILKHDQSAETQDGDAAARLKEFLKRTPAGDLLNLSISELARITGCSPRHFSRVFQEVTKVSFREKRTELRLTKACELLATTESKILDVAMESGYQSLSLFNLMFSRRFGVSPGKWRKFQGNSRITTNRNRRSGGIPAEI